MLKSVLLLVLASPMFSSSEAKSVEFHVASDDVASANALKHLSDYYREIDRSSRKTHTASVDAGLEGRWVLKAPILGTLGVMHMDFHTVPDCNDQAFFVTDAGSTRRIRPGFQNADGSGISFSVYPGDKEFMVHLVRKSAGLFSGEARTPENDNSYPVTMSIENRPTGFTQKIVHASLNGMPMPSSQNPGQLLVRDPAFALVDGTLVNHPESDGFTGCFPMETSISYTYEKSPMFAMHYLGPDPTVAYRVIQNGTQWVTQAIPSIYSMQGRYGSVELFND